MLPTPESRRDLIHLFDTTSDLRLRWSIVKALAAMGTAEELEFFSSLLGGRSTELDDKIRQYAALGLGRIGGMHVTFDFDPRARTPFDFEVEEILQVQPELGVGLEIARQAQGGIGGNPAAFVDDSTK